MPETKVKSYQRLTATGQVVTVQAYDRSNQEIAQAVTALPGRPPMAASQGKFANGRSIPGVFPTPPAPPKVSEVSAAPADGQFADQLVNRIIGKTDHLSDADFGRELLDRVLTKPATAKATKVVAAAARAILADDDTVAL